MDMETPEYLDLDQIDFSDDSVYGVSSLKNIPQLSRRNDAQAEERPAPSSISWSRGAASHPGGGGIKPTGLADAHSKFRPVKRVSPLKHQPETPESDSDGKVQGQEPGAGEAAKDKPPPPTSSGGQVKEVDGSAVFGELEHYDLDMDEILDVPYIKSSQHSSTLPRPPPARSNLQGGTLERNHRASLAHHTPFSPHLRKSKSMDPDALHLHRSPGGAAFQQEALGCSSSFSDGDQLLSARVYPEAPNQRSGMEPAGGAVLTFPLPGGSLAKPRTTAPGAGGRGCGGAAEVDEESKKKQNILNIVREGQISLLPHLAADNLAQIRDQDGNNLLHVSASQGHAECLQHLTSLMGEDGLNERNAQQLTPAGLGVKNGHLECVRWMVSETEAIAELSCTREHPSLIHYAARYGQEKVLLWLLQFMQEQAISLDEVDHNGNTGVHVAAQYGHLTCIQTLVEYGSNVTVNNQQGERPSQVSERQGHSTCARYLVVVETCMSLASQVVKLTKQLSEQAVEKVTLQKQLHRLDNTKSHGTPASRGQQQPVEAWPEMTLTAEGTPADGLWLVHQGGAGPDTVAPRHVAPPTASRDGPRGSAMAEKRARLQQIMQRSLSESDSDACPPEAPPTLASRPDRPTHLPIADEEPASKQLVMTTFSPSPTSSDPEATDTPGEADGGPKAATSPKSALKSPSSRRKTSHNLKLRVTFDEHVQRGQEAEPSRGKDRTPAGSWEAKRPFGAFRSIMESLSGNANSPAKRAEGGATKAKTRSGHL
ncbi:synphilin-1 isoform X2 [Nerophis ophidion]|uniref:synphilin-1 isoform X2 n=1 Tax=Nerophis ophidion TaxID=159077 RepID=UPI002ADFCE40|nr:synphilin-1 isoform X2 [Nerophis ophidion]